MKTVNKNPIPQGKYIPAVRHADVIYTSGMTPRKDGKLIYSGQIKATLPVETYKEAVEIATLNAITAAINCLEADEKISKVLQMSVFLNSETEFTAHSKVADFASEVVINNLGIQCVGSRAAIGVSSLPSNAPVEITLVCCVN
ncbi:RidA family protein [Algibacter pacificus]|uniref:RidA family protein n=1 Tax=Algibacter pacificus TaxID=2599389 RepID=UPI0011C71BEE|nr:RidA family protein [Algibacter pacificus]